ncbi:MAG: TonB-dependent receptor [Ignavibacteriales bacterium]|nr:TonB-dependent receptor [Ignavibacteriales bacterium]
MLKYKATLIISLIIYFLFPLIYLAQTGTLRGTVEDSTNGESLAYVNIVLDGKKLGVSTDMNGNFMLRSVPANMDYIIKVTHIGYQPKQLPVRIAEGKILQIKISLSPRNFQLDEIETLGKRVSSKTNIGLHKIAIKDLELLPKSVETDIIRSLQLLPGVQSTGDVSARYYVRGGSSDQNLMLYNGVTVYNPFHAMGLFSVIDPEIINAAEFYKGGFTAEYGERLSSVLNIVTKSGNRNKFAGSGSISFLTGKVSLEGPIPNGSFIFTARKSLFDEVLKKFLNYKETPFDFYDISFKANYSTNDDKKITKISLFSFNSNDRLKNNNSLREDFNWRNNIFGGQWFQAWESPLYSETTVSLSSYRAEVFPNKSNALHRYNKIDDITLRMDFTYMYDSRDELKVGYYIKSLNADLYFENARGFITNVHDYGANLNIYGKYTLLRFDNLVIDFGTRLCGAPLAEKNNTRIEPRLNTKYQLNDNISLKAAWGIYAQDVATFTDENEIISLYESWFVIPEYLTPSSAIHYVAGTEINFTDNISLNIEAYYKLLHNLCELNQNKVSAEDFDLVTGKGESYGWELLLKFDNRKIQTSLAYSLSWAYKEVNNKIYYPKYDSRHNLNLSLQYNLSENWDASAIWIFNSGHPFTPIKGYYDKLYFDDPFSPWYIYESYQPYTIMGSKNIRRLPYYHRLDISVTNKFSLFSTAFKLSLSIVNVYDRKNIFYFERDTGKRVNMIPFLPTVSLKVDL